MIDYGTYRFRVEENEEFGKHLELNRGGYVASRKPNPRHGGQPVMNGILVHAGYYENDPMKERGSTGCITVHPKHWRSFQEVFAKEEEGDIIVVRPPATQGIGDVKPADAGSSEQPGMPPFAPGVSPMWMDGAAVPMSARTGSEARQAGMRLIDIFDTDGIAPMPGDRNAGGGPERGGATMSDLMRAAGLNWPGRMLEGAARIKQGRNKAGDSALYMLFDDDF